MIQLSLRGSTDFDHSEWHCRPSAGFDSIQFLRPLPLVGATPNRPRNRGPFDIATLAIFPEYLEFEGQEVLRLVVEGAAGRTVA